jgi:uncharacterized protein (DUF1778 family)
MSDCIPVNQMTPGTLVTEMVSIRGGIYYDREYEQSYFDNKAQIRKWKTTSRVENVVERAQASRTRTKIYNLVRQHCVKTPVGLICPDKNKNKLSQSLEEVARERDSFNSAAKTCRIVTHYACFEVKEDNFRTLAAILDQIAEVASRVNKAITANDKETLQASPRRWLKGMKPSSILLLDDSQRDAIVARARAELIRGAIRDIKGVEALLPDNTAQKAQAIVTQSRKIARKLCNRVEKHNNALEQVLEEVDLSGIRKNRTAFVLAAVKAGKKALKEEEKISLVPPRKIIP